MLSLARHVAPTSSRSHLISTSSAVPLLERLACRHHRWLRTSSRIRANHYETLNLPRTATRQQIKAQFYRLSKEYHPDAKSGQEAKFQAISEAYATLGHPNERRAYDAAISAAGSGWSGHHRSGSTTYGTPRSHTQGQYEAEAAERRARANQAWEYARRTNPRANRSNPFASAFSGNASESASSNPFHHHEHFDRMQAREAWRAANMSSEGVRRRMAEQAYKVAQEESLRNTSSTIRAIQVIAMFVFFIWIAGGSRATAQEKDVDDAETEREQSL
ncbi:hypothetical protein EMMF5_001256 [Cystobasidiomycetes sp. EMM_F5]